MKIYQDTYTYFRFPFGVFCVQFSSRHRYYFMLVMMEKVHGYVQACFETKTNCEW